MKLKISVSTSWTLGKDVLSSSFMLLAEFSSLQLQDGGPFSLLAAVVPIFVYPSKLTFRLNPWCKSMVFPLEDAQVMKGPPSQVDESFYKRTREKLTKLLSCFHPFCHVRTRHPLSPHGIQDLRCHFGSRDLDLTGH